MNIIDDDDFWIIFGISLGTCGSIFSALLRSVFFSHFSPRRPEEHLADFQLILGVVLKSFFMFWAGVESVIFDDIIMYNHYFEGPGGRNLAFWHCFSRGLPGAPFLRLFYVFGVPGGLVVELQGAPWGPLFLKGVYVENLSL